MFWFVVILISKGIASIKDSFLNKTSHLLRPELYTYSYQLVFLMLSNLNNLVIFIKEKSKTVIEAKPEVLVLY